MLKQFQVTQISCFDYTKLAPSGCTQYFTGETKTFQTYNYNAGTGAQLANQRQQICFRYLFSVNISSKNVRIFYTFSKVSKKKVFNFEFFLF